ncbi:hypothetical protein CPB83DRAFT_890353 [Crepidotus variabilis]|uniref:Uncharacterized protein n=1 Tax=Crepidotus variabilis TaxID=179855 RepID=A0A9P6ENV5_9AGAR|nr:hypothetical protein CPB83DRAFT_890353 [Crepidotus variabilis]
MSSMNPSAMLAESLAEFSKSAYQAFTEIENKARQEVTRAAQETHDAKAERDTAMKDLHAAQLESQSWKQEAAASKATLTQAELTITHQAESLAAQVEQIAQLRREVTQWKDQSRNWQEHFLRVEQERCAQSSRIDELVVEKLQYVRPPTSTANYITPKHPKYTSQISSAPTTIGKHAISSPTQPPAYRSAGSPSAEPDTSNADSRQTPLQNYTSERGSGSRAHKTPAKPQNAHRRERDAHPDVQEIAPPAGTKPRKGGITLTSSNAQAVSAQLQNVATPSGSNIRSSTVIRRVQAVVHVKREEDTEDEGAGGAIGGTSKSGSAKPNGTVVKRKKKEESLEGGGKKMLNNRKKGIARGRSRSKRVITEDEGEPEEEEEGENDSRRGTERSASQDDDADEEEGSEERGDADKNYNLRKPYRPNYLEEDDEEDDDDELMMGAEDNHDEVYGSHPVDSSRRQNGSPRKKRKFSAR